MSKIDVDFLNLCKTVQECKLCERMNLSKRVLNRSVGSLNPTIMFIGEAPGRHGADDTDIPFHGDKSGDNFERFIAFANISRQNIYVTNAVLCNPKDISGNNSTPNKTEIINCISFLKSQISLVQPRIVVTLGSTALYAASLLESHNLQLKAAVRTSNHWYNRILIPLYHPGQRAMLHRSLANQRSDYVFVYEQYRRLHKKRKTVNGSLLVELEDILEYMLNISQILSYFAIHKLFYLIEYYSVKKFGKRLTSSYFVRQKDGPYCTDLHISKILRSINTVQKTSRNGKLYISIKQNSFFDVSKSTMNLSSDTKALVDHVMSTYSRLSDEQLKLKVYITSPMRKFLRLENDSGISTYNTPIEFE